MSSLRDASVLITGASGFIGRHLVNFLLSVNARVHTISRKKATIGKECKTHFGDISDADFIKKVVKEAEPIKVFHLAAFTNPSRDLRFVNEAFGANFYGTANLIQALKNTSCDSFIFTSTAEVYGDNEVPFSEDMPLRPVSPYSLAKASAEMYCNMEHKGSGFPVVILRPFLVYGPDQEDEKFIPNIITSLLGKKKFSMTGGEQKRDFVYVHDVVDAYIKASMAKKANGEAINVCSSRQYAIKEIANKISCMLNAENMISYDMPYRQNEQWEYCGDFAKAKKLLEWEPKIGIDAGLKLTAESYKSPF